MVQIIVAAIVCAHGVVAARAVQGVWMGGGGRPGGEASAPRLGMMGGGAPGASRSQERRAASGARDPARSP